MEDTPILAFGRVKAVTLMERERDMHTHTHTQRERERERERDWIWFQSRRPIRARVRVRETFTLDASVDCFWEVIMAVMMAMRRKTE